MLMTLFGALNEPNINKIENRIILCSYSSCLCYLVQARFHVASTLRMRGMKSLWDAECRFDSDINFILSIIRRCLHLGCTCSKMNDAIYMCANCQGPLWHFFALTLDEHIYRFCRRTELKSEFVNRNIV